MKRRAEETPEAKKRHADEKADEADRESFPASDPPAFTPTAAGAPRRERKPSARREDEKLDQAIEDSFPASDPPPTSPMTTGAPKQAEATGHPKAKASKGRKH